MSIASDERIFLSGITALLATWFYLLGLIQVYIAFKPTTVLVRGCVLTCFAGVLTAYGIVHAEYVAIAISAKLATQNQLDLSATTELASMTNEVLRLFVYPLFVVLSLIFIYQVWKRKTLYPRWILIFYPLLPFILQGFIGKLLTGNAWTIVMGGFLNLILVIFFTASTIALWKVKQKECL